MNKENRKELQKAIDIIEAAKEIITILSEEEQSKFDNLSEGLQATERGQKFEENVSTFDEAFSTLEEVIDNLNSSLE